MKTTGFHSFEIPSGVVLFLLQGAKHALAEGIRGVRKLQQGQGHQFDCEEFMVGEKMEKDAPVFFVVHLIGGRKMRLS